MLPHESTDVSVDDVSDEREDWSATILGNAGWTGPTLTWKLPIQRILERLKQLGHAYSTSAREEAWAIVFFVSVPSANINLTTACVSS